MNFLCKKLTRIGYNDLMLNMKTTKLDIIHARRIADEAYAAYIEMVGLAQNAAAEAARYEQLVVDARATYIAAEEARYLAVRSTRQTSVNIWT